MRSWPGKRDVAAKVLGRAGLVAIARTGRRAVRILAYHRVLSANGAGPGIGAPLFLFDEGVISATTEAFYHQIDFVRRNFDVISFKEFDDIETAGRPMPPRPLIITFDDGYRDNYTNAFPILKEFGIPATVFVATGHMGRGSLFWWDLVAYCFKTTRRTGVILDEICDEPLALGTSNNRRLAIERVLSWIKTAPEEARSRFVRELPDALGVAIMPGLGDDMHLSWDQIREMADSGIEFGSHTVTHPVLTNVDDDRLNREVRDSKAMLEREIRKEVIVFSYPVGGKGHFDSRTRSAVAKAGYRYALSYVDGVAGRTGIDRYAMPRIHVEADHSLNLFRANLGFPSVMLRKAAL